MNLQELSLGLYLHVPFCGSRCDYCAFYKELPTKEALSLYLLGVAKEVQTFDFSRKVNTISWGGGSPSILSPKHLEQLGNIFLPKIGSDPYEWTVEVSPTSINKEKLQTLKSLGVNRISMGIQSFSDDILQRLGRHQTAQQVYNAYDQIRICGFENINIDLIFAVKDQDLNLWQEDLKKAVALNPSHISTYCLTHETDRLDPKTSLSSDEQERFYRFTWDFLANNGYPQYEISNFAPQKYQCQHNLNTWRMQEWIGVGPSAASQYQKKRWTNAANLNAWYKGEQTEVYPLNDNILAIDSLVFGLRMNEGVQLTTLKQKFPTFDWTRITALIEKLSAARYLTLDSGILKLTTNGRLVADAIDEALF